MSNFDSNDKVAFREFSFAEFSGQHALVFISGPGYLEYPWALETAVRLKLAGAKVIIVDASKAALPLSMRLKVKGFKLPAFSRTVLRKMLLKKETRIEELSQEYASKFDIPSLRLRLPLRSLRILDNRRTNLQFFRGKTWENIDAFEMTKSFISNQLRRTVEESYSFRRSFARNIQDSIERITYALSTLRWEGILDSQSFTVFLANGRQPVQAAIRRFFVDRNIDVILYESAGGYIFPEKFPLCIDYFRSWPTNVRELESKVNRNFANASSQDKELGSMILDWIKHRTEVPYQIDYSLSHASHITPTTLRKGRNFAFFASSDWEFSIIQFEKLDGTIELEWKNQYEAVTALLEAMNSEDRLYIRLHPNDPSIRYRPETFWVDFATDPRVVLLDNESDVNSYDLGRQMNLNFVWHSIMGLEFYLTNVPVRFLGDAFFSVGIEEVRVRNKTQIRQALSRHDDHFEPSKLLPLATYLAVGGTSVIHSKTDVRNKLISIDGKNTDEPRKFWSSKNSKLIRAIS